MMTATDLATAGTEFGIHMPLLEEHSIDVEQIDGTLPKDLTGTLLRIGPGKLQVGTTLLDNIFDGDGMISRFTIDGGKVAFDNRYVRTKHFTHGETSSRVAYRGVGAMRPGGPLANFLRLPANVANTNVMLHGEELLALWELGRPHRLDFDTLETLGLEDFGGTLRWVGAFSAHPKWDPSTGEMFNFGLDVFPSPRIRCYRRDRAGKLTQFASVPMLDLPWNHDFALTENYLVFVLDPIMPNLRKLVASSCSYLDALDYRPAKGTRFVLVPRAGGKPRIVEHDALLHFHVTNAYEENGDVVVDLINFGDSWTQLKQAIGHVHGDHALPDSRLMRYRVTPAGRVVEQELSSYTSEFPQFDWRVATRRNRYSYHSGRTQGPHLGSLIKIDHDTGKNTAHYLAGHTIGEALFVPRTRDAAEDDGWLLAMAHDHAETRTKLVVLDARDVEQDPIATAHLPFNVPLGFHGQFTRRIPTP